MMDASLVNPLHISSIIVDFTRQNNYMILIFSFFEKNSYSAEFSEILLLFLFQLFFCNSKLFSKNKQKNSTFSNSRIFKNEDDNFKKYFIESRKILFYTLIIHCTLVVSECDPEIEIPCSIGYSMDSSMFPIHHDIDYVVAQHLNPIYLLRLGLSVDCITRPIFVYIYIHTYFLKK